MKLGLEETSKKPLPQKLHPHRARIGQTGWCWLAVAQLASVPQKLHPQLPRLSCSEKLPSEPVRHLQHS